jgi:hypothetical protein
MQWRRSTRSDTNRETRSEELFEGSMRMVGVYVSVGRMCDLA